MQIDRRNLKEKKKKRKKKKRLAPVIMLDLSGQYNSRNFQAHNVTAHNDEHTPDTHFLVFAFVLKNHHSVLALHFRRHFFSITKSFAVACIDMCRHPDTRDYCEKFCIRVTVVDLPTTAACRCATALMYVNVQRDNNV